jgi:hypothetical protein
LKTTLVCPCSQGVRLAGSAILRGVCRVCSAAGKLGLVVNKIGWLPAATACIPPDSD